MSWMQSSAPAQNDALRQAIFQGQIFLLPPSPASLQLCERVESFMSRCGDFPTPVENTGPAHGVQFWHQQLSPETLHQRLTHLRQMLMDAPEIQAHYKEILRELAFDLAACRVDAPRLRGIAPELEKRPEAAAVFYAHRDTWYANPQSQINLWIPLFDYPREQTFSFWPACFDRAVANDSEQFNYRDWGEKVGFQNPSPPESSVYPQAPTPPETGEQGFACQRGQRLLFAAAQLHRTRPNPGPHMRYSLDLRIVHTEDEKQGRGAPNADNRSRGTTLPSYDYLQQLDRQKPLHSHMQDGT